MSEGRGRRGFIGRLVGAIFAAPVAAAAVAEPTVKYIDVTPKKPCDHKHTHRANGSQNIGWRDPNDLFPSPKDGTVTFCNRAECCPCVHNVDYWRMRAAMFSEAYRVDRARNAFQGSITIHGIKVPRS